MIDSESSRRLGIGVFAALLLLVIGAVLYVYIALVVFAIFLYYAVRPIFRFLDRFALSRSQRAMLSLTIFGVPFLVLIAYSVAVIAIEVKLFLEERGLLEDATDRLIAELNIAELDLAELQTLVTETDGASNVDIVFQSLIGAAGAVGTALIQLFIVVVATYYMLVDGPKLIDWFLETYDESGVLREYVDHLDPEIAVTLFGNIVNLFVTGIIGIVTFYVFNFFAPATVEIPFPALLGALIGIGSLIPVVGMKVVYVPLSAFLAGKAWVAGEPELLGSVAVLFVVSAVIIDFIPDLVIRARMSADRTHTGLLMLAYILGPSLFGFYGLFLAPILLIATINAVDVLLPYAIGGRIPASRQATIDEFSANGAGGASND
jgi:predicted PurR-regulated permease PerM